MIINWFYWTNILRINQEMNIWMNKSMNECMDEYIIHESLKGWINKLIN